VSGWNEKPPPSGRDRRTFLQRECEALRNELGPDQSGADTRHTRLVKRAPDGVAGKTPRPSGAVLPREPHRLEGGAQFRLNPRRRGSCSGLRSARRRQRLPQSTRFRGSLETAVVAGRSQFR
jgi:hypothetical protein